VPKLKSFDAYPDIPLNDVRDKHTEARKALISGIDPMAFDPAPKNIEASVVRATLRNGIHLVRKGSWI